MSEQFTLQVCGPDHLDTLHEWLNDPRVDEFWEEKGSLEQHKKFIDERTADAHTISVIGSYIGANQDGEVNGMLAPATYSEIYWVKEDRLGPLMSDVRDYDRGENMATADIGPSPLDLNHVRPRYSYACGIRGASRTSSHSSLDAITCTLLFPR